MYLPSSRLGIVSGSQALADAGNYIAGLGHDVNLASTEVLKRTEER